MHPPVHAVAAAVDDHDVGGRSASGIRNFKGHRERPLSYEIEAVAAIYSVHFRRQMTVVEIITANCIVCPTAGTLLTAERRMCSTVGDALSETVATISLRTEKMLSMFRLQNKKCSETGPNRRCSGPEQYQKQFRYDL